MRADYFSFSFRQRSVAEANNERRAMQSGWVEIRLDPEAIFARVSSSGQQSKIFPAAANIPVCLAVHTFFSYERGNQAAKDIVEQALEALRDAPHEIHAALVPIALDVPATRARGQNGLSFIYHIADDEGRAWTADSITAQGLSVILQIGEDVLEWLVEKDLQIKATKNS